jgi:hypothetical protein
LQSRQDPALGIGAAAPAWQEAEVKPSQFIKAKRAAFHSLLQKFL